MKPSLVFIKATVPAVLRTNINLLVLWWKHYSSGAFLLFLINYSNGKGTGNGLKSKYDISDVHRISELATQSLGRG